MGTRFAYARGLLSIPRLSLLTVVLIAIVFNTAGLNTGGYGNEYYAAAARSMADNWHNFFFGAFDPGGFITVDKPPVFLWADAISVRIFSFSSVSLLIPSAVAGVASVVLLWLIIRRYFGLLAATLASLVLTSTPISVAVDRANVAEPFYILALIGAVGAVLLSIERRHWWIWIALAGVLVGVAFNTKMLAAWIPGPSLALAVVVGVERSWRSSWRKWLPRLALLLGTTLIVSASWMVIVDAWPASSRPYVGGSTNNTVEDLVLGYNGLGRIEGSGVGNTGTHLDGGRPGPLRMFDSANAGMIAWFMPLALIGWMPSLWLWRKDRVRRAAILAFTGWVLLFGTVFSFSHGIFHSYYTAALTPGIAALAAITVSGTSALAQRNRAWILAALGPLIVTIWFQFNLVPSVNDAFDWVPPWTFLAIVIGFSLLTYAALWNRQVTSLGIAVVLVGLLFVPLAWLNDQASHASVRAAFAQSAAYGGLGSPEDVNQLAHWLRRNNSSAATWDLAVARAPDASVLIAQDDVAVLPLGGFSGNDPTLTVQEFGRLVTTGKVRFVFLSSTSSTGESDAVSKTLLGANPRGAAYVMSAVQTNCTVVTDSSLPDSYRGSLFDCAGSTLY